MTFFSRQKQRWEPIDTDSIHISFSAYQLLYDVNILSLALDSVEQRSPLLLITMIYERTRLEQFLHDVFVAFLAGEHENWSTFFWLHIAGISLILDQIV